ncbi:hypothetical protein [Methylobacter sp.]|uniref:hypothetical protein n=1 Tax=Methylobacter sp. TaxID=2051955 RepID=UPI002488B8E2|nr:hypothetical protein [Methylobacter sp.]MDI1279524.1 hypothetical protein [Methylobacter sp.]MDI1360273.1 hypothetical protein [Methylobacter sp.]
MNQEQNQVKKYNVKFKDERLSNAQILCLIMRYNSSPFIPFEARLDKQKNRIVIGSGSGHRIDIGVSKLRSGLLNAEKIAIKAGVQS